MCKNLKIGIVTFHCAYNYGSVLQAYALEKYLLKNYKNVEVIDYRSKNFKLYRLVKYRSFLNPKLLIDDLKNLKRNYKRKKAFWNFINEKIILSDKTYSYKENLKCLNDKYDIFICGSDQIWNAVCTNGLDSNFFLNFVTTGVKIAYAPSLAHENFPQEILNEIKNYLESFDAVSVRENSGKRILDGLYAKEVQVIVDPTMLLTDKDYIALMKNAVNKSNYIFMYMLETDNQEMMEYAYKLSQIKQCQIIYIHKNNILPFENAENVYGISPNEFLEYIYKADYVVTNSFHATVFSILFEKKFCTFKTIKSYSRMVDLLKNLNLDNRIYHDDIDIDTDIEYKQVKNTLEELREPSEEFLNKAICLEKKLNN